MVVRKNGAHEGETQPVLSCKRASKRLLRRQFQIYSSLCTLFSRWYHKDRNSPIVCLLSDSPSLQTTYPRDNTVVEGNKLTLLCKVTASNPRPNITWYSVSANDTVLSYEANFTFSNISRHDAGKYFCAADNGIGKAVTSRISSIEVHCK